MRLGDVRPDGRLRLDALTRYAQDVSNDDTSDVDLPDDLAWVVRRTTVDVLVPAVLGEELEIVTFCSGLGRRWAERRLEVFGDCGGRYEVATLWIHIDVASGRPRTLSDRFLEIYGEAAAGRKVSARLAHGVAPVDAGRRVWPLRRVDFDVFNHVNNAAYWATVEELLPAWPGDWSAGTRCTVEYREGVSPGDSVVVAELVSDQMVELWWLTAAKQAAASARLTPLEQQWYRGDRSD